MENTQLQYILSNAIFNGCESLDDTRCTLTTKDEKYMFAFQYVNGKVESLMLWHLPTTNDVELNNAQTTICKHLIQESFFEGILKRNLKNVLR